MSAKMETLVHKMNQTEALISERGSIYGPPHDDFKRVAVMTSQLADCPDGVLKHILYMIIVKVCRLVVTPTHEDSWLDIVGYARNAAMIMDLRKANRE